MYPIQAEVRYGALEKKIEVNAKHGPIYLHATPILHTLDILKGGAIGLTYCRAILAGRISLS